MVAESASVTFELKQPSQAELDAALEREIATAYLAAVESSDPDFARAGFAAMTALIKRRSPAQIERMEKEQGLSR